MVEEVTLHYKGFTRQAYVDSDLQWVDLVMYEKESMSTTVTSTKWVFVKTGPLRYEYSHTESVT